MFRCTRRLDWDAAHRVLRHESKCASLHGHRYVAEITCEATRLDHVCRVVDFGVIKELVGAWIDMNFDHTTLVNPDDADLLTFCGAQSDKAPKDNLAPQRRCFIMPRWTPEPTAEAIAAVLFSVTRGLLTAHGHHLLRVVNVRVYETPNCFADFSEENL